MILTCPYCHEDCDDMGTPPGTATACPNCGKVFRIPDPKVLEATIKKEEPQSAGKRMLDWAKIEHQREIRRSTRKRMARIADAIEERKATGLSCPKCNSRQTRETFGSAWEKTMDNLNYGPKISKMNRDTWTCKKCGYTWRP